MSTSEGADDLASGLRANRLEAFSDGVFAIAATLLVLDLTLVGEGDAWERLRSAWPLYLAYIVSFLTIGAAWLAHSAITDRLERCDIALFQINLMLLLAVGVLPFPTRLVAESIRDVNGERLFVAFYGIVLLAIRLLIYALDAYSWREGLYGDRPAAERSSRSIAAVVGSYVAAIAIGVVLPAVAVILCCIIAIMLVVPISELRRLVRRS